MNEILNRYTGKTIIKDINKSIKTLAQEKKTNLSGADLFGANLSGANLFEADLYRANLSGADLSGADLSETVLDPKNIPNQKWQNFEELDKDWIIGYRTRSTQAAGRILIDNRIYGCPVFSTCENTECHPGWYLWPTLEQSKQFSEYSEKFIKVKTRKIDIHKAGTKYRSRMIWVIGDADGAQKNKA